MKEFRSLHLQKNLGEVLAAVGEDPVVLLNRGQPRAVVMSADEFRRLKKAAGEAVPRAALPRVMKVVGGSSERRRDPLGVDTRAFPDFSTLARTMADVAMSGRNAEAVRQELSRVRQFVQRASLSDAERGQSEVVAGSAP